jgi:hypothetical protein
VHLVVICLPLTHSETFNAYINEEMFARQPANKFTSRVPKKLLEKNQELFLEYRTKALYGAPDILPSIVRRAADFFMRIEGTSGDGARSAQIRNISATIISESRESVSLLVAPTPTMYKGFALNTDLQNALAIGTAQNNAQVVSASLRYGASPWDMVHLMGKRPLIMAVKSQHDGIIIMVLAEMSKDDRGHAQKLRSIWVIHAITVALRLDDQLLPGRLLQWHTKHINKPTIPYLNDLFGSAVASGSLLLLGDILDLGFAGTLQDRYVGHVLRGFKSNKKAPEILRLCTEKELITGVTRYRQHQDDKVRSILQWAVEAESAILVKIVLAMDDFMFSYFRSGSILRKAIKSNNAGIVRHLLKHGFDPEGGRDRKARSTMDIARKDSAVFEMLQKAITKKIKQAGSVYRAPERLV